MECLPPVSLPGDSAADPNRESMTKPRAVCWFSCGVTSAIAARLTLDLYRGHEIRIVYCDTRSEHPDNYRFMDEWQEHLNHPIERIGSDEYRDIWDVFDKTRWLVGPQGARCTAELKKRVRFNFQEPDDIQVFGFDSSENDRAERFRQNNPEIHLETPLIALGRSKLSCAEEVMRAGIELPEIYRLGFRNANCIGCPKGQMGYWNKIRSVFPDVFARMSKVERDLDVAINKSYAGDGERKRVFLDELDPDAGNYEAEPSIECGLSCGVQETLFGDDGGGNS